ncbi:MULTISPECIES: hypothetical protein [unclassified Streptomyces]|uniref:hypothetical protein n=1 Tax=unclassified Streptomyces TaxID=2593676 RepID=UPI00224E8731|nr:MULTISPECIES: hypothetical protein [unclassified Streptomyces]MCX5331279.1 hypothetical protein [Streptomyces sp. NBC_00140]MCX5360673.1 hypothetical protein [Streptomyces sp. NBC_00124]
MPADEVTHGADVEGSRARTGPRHAAPKKPLFTRFHMPAGKAIALAAMPTAVLMGMGFTPTLANAEDQPASKSLTADEYKDCVTALEDGASASASPSPSASASDSDDDAEATPSASASPGSDSGGDSSSDSGSDDEAEPTPSASASSSSAGSNDAQSGATATPSPSASESSGNVLEEIGDAIEGIFTGGESASPSASASPTPSASASESASDDSKDDDASDAVKDTTGKVADTVEDTVKDTTDAASKAAEDTTDAVEKAADAVTASPSPSSSTDVDDCPVATDAEGGVDNTVPLPADPWYLNASSLLLKGADYKGIVKVRTADGTVKEVLKYVISDGTDIGDLHQTVKDEQSGKTYHVQAAKGSTSTIRDGDTVMYTESISGNLLGLIPVTFSPESPPPLNIPLIYFTKVTVVQAGQFGGTLHVPGLHNYTTD